MSWLTTLPTSRNAWGMLAITALFLEVTALFFQYSMGLEPCIMCIYQRTAVLGILIAGFMGLFAKNNRLLRLVAFITWGVSSIWGYLLAKEHLNMQTTTDPFAFTCDIVPNFPSFMPLHEWIPLFFAATGDCGSIDWQFAGFSMPGWMEIIFALYAFSFLIFTPFILWSLMKK